MIQKQEVQGICCTCTIRSGCRSLINSSILGRMVFFCEEFDDPDEYKNRRPIKAFGTMPCMDIKSLLSL